MPIEDLFRRFEGTESHPPPTYQWYGSVTDPKRYAAVRCVRAALARAARKNSDLWQSFSIHESYQLRVAALDALWEGAAEVDLPYLFEQAREDEDIIVRQHAQRVLAKFVYVRRVRSVLADVMLREGAYYSPGAINCSLSAFGILSSSPFEGAVVEAVNLVTENEEIFHRELVRLICTVRAGGTEFANPYFNSGRTWVSQPRDPAKLYSPFGAFLPEGKWTVGGMLGAARRTPRYKGEYFEKIAVLMKLAESEDSLGTEVVVEWLTDTDGWMTEPLFDA